MMRADDLRFSRAHLAQTCPSTVRSRMLSSPGVFAIGFNLEAS
jgi:hypothetical protein